MSLSEEILAKRYNHLDRVARIQQMIEDMVDSPIVMKEVRAYGRDQFSKGQKDERSRAANKPGDGDMGG